MHSRAQVLTVAGLADGGRTVSVAEAIVYNHYGGEYQAEVG